MGQSHCCGVCPNPRSPRQDQALWRLSIPCGWVCCIPPPVIHVMWHQPHRDLCMHSSKSWIGVGELLPIDTLPNQHGIRLWTLRADFQSILNQHSGSMELSPKQEYLFTNSQAQPLRILTDTDYASCRFGLKIRRIKWNWTTPRCLM